MLFVAVFLGLLLSADGYNYPFQDPSLPWDQRVDDLVNRLTVDELTQQMARGGRTTFAPPITRLGVKPYSWGTECLRGDVDAGPATSFPQALGLSAAFSRELVYNVTWATGLEVRAKFNNYTSHGEYGQHKGVSCWSPVINIMRDPRWGRNQETYGEDPYMSGELAKAYVYGLQGSHPRYIMANAGCKHFDVYAGPENIPVSRHKFDAKVTERDWRMTFLPQFRACVQAGTYSLMCSYNRINGIPACANRKLLTDILRGEWGFHGYVISDEGAIEDIMDNHKYTSTKADTAAVAVNAGTNLEDGPQDTPPYFNAISEAVSQGKLTEDTVRKAAKPLFYTRMRLGDFDPLDMNPYSSLRPEDFVQSASHRDVSLVAAMKTFVLLKNHGGLLPLTSGNKYKTAAIVGPFADNLYAQFGAYTPQVDPKYSTTPRQGLADLADSVKYAPGCQNSDTACNDYNSSAIMQAVSDTEIVVVCLGTGVNIEGESNDRKDISLPGKQIQLLQDAVKAAAGAPVILLLFNAGPLDVTWAQSSTAVTVIMECFFPAQATGEALRRVLFNDGPGANPAGRMPATWPASLAEYPDITDYTMQGRTYRYPAGQVLYPFGYGLSYTRFSYHTLDVRPMNVTFPNMMYIDVYVYNEGPLDGEEVVQAYVAWNNPSLPTPSYQLVAFGRYFIPKNEGITVTFQVDPAQLAVWDDGKGYVVLSGSYTLYVGGQQPGQPMSAPSNVLKANFMITV